MKALIICFSAALAVLGVGCAALSWYVTPADLDNKSVEYVVDAGIADSNDYKVWLWPNLEMADRLSKDVDNAHSVVQFELQSRISRDNLDYAIHKNVTAANLSVGKQREEMLFSETGLFSMGLSLAGFGTLTGYLGLMRRRPGDIAKEEADKLLTNATSEKEKQFAEVVIGVKKFMDTFENPKDPVVIKLKEIFDGVQRTDTKVAVATALKTNPV